jgi:UrcA family protein
VEGPGRPLRLSRTDTDDDTITTIESGRTTMNIDKLKLAALAAIAALASTGGGIAALTAPAFAAEVKSPAAVVATVSYGDLNLRTPAGVDRLNARIRAAAERLCIEPGVKGLDASLAGIECRDALIAAAAGQVQAASGTTYAAAGTITLARAR